MIINQGSNYEVLMDIASAAMTNGEFKTLNSINGFAIGNVENGALYGLVYKCNKAKANKDSTVSILRGQVVYYNTTNKNVTNVAGSNVKIGIALEAVGVGGNYIMIEFDGTLGV
jgi:predicted RecA/RadA family phage recombinase